MNQVKIQEEIGKVQNELTKYGLMTPGKGIDFPVSISIEKMENDYGKMKKHLKAKWMEYSCVRGEMVERVKIEELNEYFDGELFAHGITQRADYIKADVEDIKEYLKQFGGRSSIVHPALYSEWLESKKVA